MKKLFLTILLLLSSVSLSFAAISPHTIWEIRTTGASDNGGGFNPNNASAGTDYSQQDTAQLSLTDLASTSASSWLTLTSATGGFTAQMVGNIIYIASGTNFTAGYYEITAYTDTNTVTVDRACGATGDASGGSGKVGGAVDHPQRITTSVAKENIVYVKKGTYQPIDGNAFVLTTYTNGRQAWIGYDTSRTEIPIGDDRVTFDGNGQNYALYINGSQHLFKNIIFTGALLDGARSAVEAPHFVNCRFTLNTRYGYSMNANSVYMLFYEIDNNGSDGTEGPWYGNFISYAGYIHDNGGRGLIGYSQTTTFVDSVLDSNSTTALEANYSIQNFIAINSVLYNNTTAGIVQQGTDGNSWFFSINSSYHTNGSVFHAHDGDTMRPGFVSNNSYYNNTNLYTGQGFTNNRNGGWDSANLSWGEVTTDPSFTNAAEADFTLQSGSPLIGAGLDLSTFTSLTTDFNVNIGIDQGDHTVGGGGGAHSYGFSN